jgi:hypothetical protein
VGSLLKPLLKKVTPVVGSRMLCTCKYRSIEYSTLHNSEECPSSTNLKQHHGNHHLHRRWPRRWLNAFSWYHQVMPMLTIDKHLWKVPPSQELFFKLVLVQLIRHQCDKRKWGSWNTTVICKFNPFLTQRLIHDLTSFFISFLFMIVAQLDVDASVFQTS